MWMGGYWTFFAMIFAFGIIPIVEYLVGTNMHNLDEMSSQIAEKDKMYDIILFSVVPLQVILLWFFVSTVSQKSLSTVEIIGYITCYGISAGVLGINVAHELGHRKSVFEQTLAKILLASSLYMHFFIEHNRGHHNRVATDEDPASARYGESFYAFVPRAMFGGWLSAWDLEKVRLGGKPWTLRNELIVYMLIQASIVACIYMFYGGLSTIAFIIAAFMGGMLLELVNYIEHYGLRRKKINEKRYERALPIHSWNSDFVVGRIILFELTRHSDHHYQSDRKYQILRHFDESPQLPAGYPAMMLLAMVPPLWFKVMHPKIEKLSQISAIGS
jgi:alkane 1-monooxygenase